MLESSQVRTTAETSGLLASAELSATAMAVTYAQLALLNRTSPEPGSAIVVEVSSNHFHEPAEAEALEAEVAALVAEVEAAEALVEALDADVDAALAEVDAADALVEACVAEVEALEADVEAAEAEEDAADAEAAAAVA